MPRSALIALPVFLLAAQDNTVFKTDVKVVNVFATVHDKHGKIVRDLKKEDFTLTEDGRPQAITYFSQESNLPLTLGLLIDTSGSQRNVLGQERTASRRFLDQVLREDKDHGFLLHFDREVELLQDLTSSRKKLQDALDLLEAPQMQRYGGGGGPGGGTSGGGGGQNDGGGYGGRGGRRGGGGGGTALYDAVYLAANDVLKNQTGRKAVIVLSDGVDRGSKETLTEAIESAQRADTLVYSILFADHEAYGNGMGPRMGGRRGGMGGGGMGGGGMGGGRGRYPQQEQRPDGKKILERLSQETGGSFFEVSKKHTVEDIYNEIEEELRNQYSLGYTPDKAGGSSGYRTIAVTLGKKDLIVQARAGYYSDK
ncbi:MAG TPA: VWA domain-containing protein [Bryobacteraceae bacterium]|nr:VWA domain-containing protein [Bryobacteraceae bacterium]